MLESARRLIPHCYSIHVPGLLNKMENCDSSSRSVEISSNTEWADAQGESQTFTQSGLNDLVRDLNTLKNAFKLHGLMKRISFLHERL